MGNRLPSTPQARDAARAAVAERCNRTAFAVAALLVQGLTYPQIAERLGIHRNTVTKYAHLTRENEEKQ